MPAGKNRIVHLGVNGIRLTTTPSGVGRYIENVLRGWSGLRHPFDEVRVYTPGPLDAGVRIPEEMRHVVASSRGPLWLWEQSRLPRIHGKKAILFCPSYVAPCLARCPIVLVHHGSYEGYPQAFDRWTRARSYLAFRLSARRADHIITVSEHSKTDIVRFYGVSKEKVTVIPPGVDKAIFRPIEDTAALSLFRTQVFGEDQPFILFVGKPARRRNVPALLTAYARLVQESDSPPRFLFIGADLPGCPVVRLVQQLGLQRHVTLMNHASHETIALAYNASRMLVYPSSYEGFGLPVLEAMACGTPAIALRNTAFLEFADGAAWLADDAEPDTLLHAMRTVLQDESLRERMRRIGLQRTHGEGTYDWKVISERIMSLLVEMHERMAA